MKYKPIAGYQSTELIRKYASMQPQTDEQMDIQAIAAELLEIQFAVAKFESVVEKMPKLGRFSCELDHHYYGDPFAAMVPDEHGEYIKYYDLMTFLQALRSVLED